MKRFLLILLALIFMPFWAHAQVFFTDDAETQDTGYWSTSALAVSSAQAHSGRYAFLGVLSGSTSNLPGLYNQTTQYGQTVFNYNGPPDPATGVQSAGFAHGNVNGSANYLYLRFYFYLDANFALSGSASVTLANPAKLNSGSGENIGIKNSGTTGAPVYHVYAGSVTGTTAITLGVWHETELKYQYNTAGVLTLDGATEIAAATAGSRSDINTISIGVSTTDTGAAGNVYLDDIVASTSPIGPACGTFGSPCVLQVYHPYANHHTSLMLKAMLTDWTSADHLVTTYNGVQQGDVTPVTGRVSQAINLAAQPVGDHTLTVQLRASNDSTVLSTWTETVHSYGTPLVSWDAYNNLSLNSAPAGGQWGAPGKIFPVTEFALASATATGTWLPNGWLNAHGWLADYQSSNASYNTTTYATELGTGLAYTSPSPCSVGTPCFLPAIGPGTRAPQMNVLDQIGANANSAGVTSLSLYNSFGAAQTLYANDKFTLNNNPVDTTVYTVGSDTTISATSSASVTISPALAVATTSPCGLWGAPTRCPLTYSDPVTGQQATVTSYATTFSGNNALYWTWMGEPETKTDFVKPNLYLNGSTVPMMLGWTQAAHAASSSHPTILDLYGYVPVTSKQQQYFQFPNLVADAFAEDCYAWAGTGFATCAANEQRYAQDTLGIVPLTMIVEDNCNPNGGGRANATPPQIWVQIWESVILGYKGVSWYQGQYAQCPAATNATALPAPLNDVQASFVNYVSGAAGHPGAGLLAPAASKTVASNQTTDPNRVDVAAFDDGSYTWIVAARITDSVATSGTVTTDGSTANVTWAKGAAFPTCTAPNNSWSTGGQSIHLNDPTTGATTAYLVTGCTSNTVIQVSPTPPAYPSALPSQYNQPGGEDTLGALSTTLTLGGSSLTGMATVYQESRTVPVSGGVFTDNFAPYAVHIYQISDSPPAVSMTGVRTTGVVIQ